ncbi:hypothetical protein CLOSTHATH_04409 [Hungatella hathewayi DSM 13479]|uniref:Uncharacterized protein n=1 Tax=Hungatella hathewayi DSM 13479 TaxID=566550 RepID=D3ALB3_9FIRM|nr:hypothetical protein CLOSTHATH_04409 [Hungatella hathewayi DSM 13479]
MGEETGKNLRCAGTKSDSFLALFVERSGAWPVLQRSGTR